MKKQVEKVRKNKKVLESGDFVGLIIAFSALFYSLIKIVKYLLKTFPISLPF